MSRPAKRSIAVVVRNGKQILALRRPDDDDELPGIWGLPAGSYRQTETREDLIRRIGENKLGVSMAPLRLLTSGVQERSTYRLEMELWEASVQGEPTLGDWKWTLPSALQAGCDQGSLCCHLALGFFSDSV